MKILIIGGNGTIGKKVTARMKEAHEVIIGGRKSGDLTIDIADSASIERGLNQIGKLDAIVNISGEAKWDTFENLSEEDFYI